jgi:hypothetical protein
MGIMTGSMPPATAEKLRYHFVAGYAGFPLIGCAATVSARLEMLSDLGVAGVVLTFARYKDDLVRFTSEVLPLQVKAGLRKMLPAHHDSRFAKMSHTGGRAQCNNNSGTGFVNT